MRNGEVSREIDYEYDEDGNIVRTNVAVGYSDGNRSNEGGGDNSYRAFSNIEGFGGIPGVGKQKNSNKSNLDDPPRDTDDWVFKTGVAAYLTTLWALGLGPDEYTFEAGIANAMRNAWKVIEARNFYYKQINAQRKNLKDGVSNYTGNFGIEGLLRAGLDPIEQFVGSYRIDIDSSDGKNLIFTLTNPTSMNSLTYKLGPSWERTTWRPGGTVIQRYSWTEPIDFSRLP